MMQRLFGTDGIRGKAGEEPLTPGTLVQLGKAIGTFFAKQNRKSKVLIGKDTRLSGYMIENSITAGITAVGVDVLLVGPLPTPAVAHLTKSFAADAGVIISASHNPFQDNGLKIFTRGGHKLCSNDAEEIERMLERPIHVKTGEVIGKAFRIDDARGRYIEFVKSSVQDQSLENLRVVIDCAHGAAYKMAKWIFSELGAETILCNAQPNGLNINNNCGATHVQALQIAVKAHRADLGIALDGDADRVILCDEKGKIIDGDGIIAVFADYLKRQEELEGVAITVMSNMGLKEFLQAREIEIIETPVGDQHVVEAMKKHDLILGGEQSGHIIFGKYSTTGDGMLTGLQFLRLMKETGKTASALSSIWRAYPQAQVNVPVTEKKELSLVPGIEAVIVEAKRTLGEQGRVLVRYSGTEPVLRILVEGKNNTQVKDLAQHIAETVKRQLGDDTCKQ